MDRRRAAIAAATAASGLATLLVVGPALGAPDVAAASSKPAAPPAAPPPQPAPPIKIAVVALADDLGAVRPACQEVYRALAVDARFRPEADDAMRSAMEEPPPADPNLLQALDALSRARAAFSAVALETTVAEARTATRDALRARPDLAQTTLLADAATLEGVAQHLLGQGDGADHAFRFAVALDPGRKLDPIVYRPDIVERFNRVRELKTTTGKLIIRSTPGGARVEVDGRQAGQTPRDKLPALVLEGLPSGDHLIAVHMPGFWPQVYTKTTQPSFPAEVNVNFGRAEKPIHVRDLVVALRSAASAGVPEAEGQLRAELARVLEVDALVMVTAAEGGPADPERTASVSIYDGRNAARLGDRVLELGRSTPSSVAAEIWRLIPARPPEKPTIIVIAPPPPAPPAPRPPVWRRWWFMTGLGAILVAGSVGGAVLLSDTTYRPELRPFQ